MPAPATLTVTAGFPPPVVHATQAGKITASVSHLAGAVTTVAGTAYTTVSAT